MALDSFSGSIFASLIANGLAALVSYGVKKTKEITKRREIIYESLQNDGELMQSIRDLMGSISGMHLFDSNKLRDTMM